MSSGRSGERMQTTATKAVPSNSPVVYSAVPSDSSKIEPIDRTLSLRRTFQVSWWDRRTPKEKKLIICVPILVILILVIIAIFASVLSKPNQANINPQGNASLSAANSGPAETCVTWECVENAAVMMQSMDRSVDPCSDFFKYACGALSSRSDEESTATHFARIRAEQDTRLRELFEAPDSPDHAEVIRTVKGLYKSCAGDEYFSSFNSIEQLIWTDQYLAKESNNTKFDLSHFLAELRLLTNEQGIFFVAVEADAKQSNRNIIYFDQPSRLPYIPSMNLSSTEHSESSHSPLLSGLTTFFGLFGDVPDKNKTKDIVKEVFAVDAEMKKIFVPLTERRDYHQMYNRMTVAEMYRNLTERVDWLKFLRTIFDSVNINIDYDEQVVVSVPEFFIKLGDLLNRHSDRAIAAYLMLGAHSDLIDLISKRHSIDIDLSMLHGSDSEPDPFSRSQFTTWSRCIRFFKDSFGLVVSRMYLDEYFQKRNKEKVTNMTQEIRAAFGELVSETSWMDDKSKRLIQEKIEAMEAKIGYPENIFNDTYLAEVYRDFSPFLEKRSFSESAVEIRKFIVGLSFANLRKPVDRTRWLAPPITVNAFHFAIRNEITIPAGIIEPPFYKDIDFTRALNFGGIGFVIGHEITHGFGDKGIQFDKLGHLNAKWLENTTSGLQERSKCFVDKYNAYTVSGVPIDGLRTLGENIADDGGLRQAFRAYRNWVSRQGREEPLLPGLNLSGNQLFFLQFAQVLCSKSEFEYYTTESAKTRVHCPPKIRVLGTLSNSNDFVEAYGCKKGTQMNADPKCRIW